MKTISDGIRAALIVTALLLINRWCEISKIFAAGLGDNSALCFKLLENVGVCWSSCYLITAISFLYLFDYLIAHTRDLPIIRIAALLMIFTSYIVLFIISSIIEWRVLPMAFGYGVCPIKSWDWAVLLVGVIAALNWIRRKWVDRSKETVIT